MDRTKDLCMHRWPRGAGTYEAERELQTPHNMEIPDRLDLLSRGWQSIYD